MFFNIYILFKEKKMWNRIKNYVNINEVKWKINYWWCDLKFFNAIVSYLFQILYAVYLIRLCIIHMYYISVYICIYRYVQKINWLNKGRRWGVYEGGAAHRDGVYYFDLVSHCLFQDAIFSPVLLTQTAATSLRKFTLLNSSEETEETK